MALEYVYRYRRTYQAVLWARADTSENLATDGLLLAQTLRLPGCESAEQEIVLAALKRWLEHHSDWLLILDNLVDLELLNTFLPLQYRGHVLLTTRIQATGAFASPLPVLPLDTEEGARLLLRRARLLQVAASEKEDSMPHYRQVQEIVRLLDGLPLALDQAGAYIEETGESLEQYLHLYQQRRADLLSYRGRGATGHPTSVSATFTLAFAQVEQLHQPAADLLRLCAFLHPATIPESLLLTETSSDEPVGPLPEISDRAELNVALGVLLMFSLVRRSPETRSLSVHRLIQVVIRDAMAEGEQHLWAERAVALVSRAWPERGMDGWTRCQEYLSHALSCAELIARLDLRSEEALRLLSEVGAYLSERAFYQEAERLLLQALVLSEELHGTNDLATASALQELGWLAHRRNQYEPAEERYRRALAIREQVAGPEHPQTAHTLYTLGLLHLNRRDLAQAAALLERALAIQEQKLGPEHSQVAETLNALGMLARVQEQYELAEELYRRAQAIREKVLGADAPETATSVSNLAALAFNRGDYERAEPFYRGVLEMRERTLGSEHPDTAATISTLALLSDLRKRYAEGIVLARRALAIQEETPGREHRETAQTIMTLAMLFYHQEDFQQAETLGREALAVRERILHSHDPNIITSLNNLALIYRAQGKYEQARPLLLRALALSEAAYGGEHNRTADIRANLATLPPQSKPPADDSAPAG